MIFVNQCFLFCITCNYVSYDHSLYSYTIPLYFIYYLQLFVLSLFKWHLYCINKTFRCLAYKANRQYIIALM